MATDIHLYTNGNDPFIFQLNEFILHVHAGSPPGGSSTILGPAPEADVAPEPEVAPVAPMLTASQYPRPTRVGLPIGLTRVEDVGEMQTWLNSLDLGSGGQPVRLRLDTFSGPARLGIHTLLAGLQDSGAPDHAVNVDIVGWSDPGDD